MREIRFGLRRYWFALALFGGVGLGFVAWSRTIERPTFVFPFGRLDPENASLVVLIVGLVAIAYAIAMSYVRFVKRPVVVLGDGEVRIPQGELALTTVTLRTGDVLAVRIDGPRRGGWRTCHVRHRGGILALRSSQLPSDDAFFEI